MSESNFQESGRAEAGWATYSDLTFKEFGFDFRTN